MATLKEAIALAEWMRSAGVLHARVGDIEITLTEQAPSGGTEDDDEDEGEAPSPPAASIEDEPDLFGAKNAAGVPKLHDYSAEDEAAEVTP